MTLFSQSGVSAPSSAWRSALIALLAILLTIIVLYRETAAAMVDIWVHSETFTHAFLVPPISLWLIWRLRKEIALMVPAPSLWALLALFATGFFWLLGELATVGVVSQFAFMTMIVLAVPALLGLQIARRIVFPLAFLYFAVPFGEFALPKFMEWTADFTVLGLRMSGIPVYREGLHFVIPSGSWSVVEACSGVRYLIASVTVGTLFAYLNYYSLKRRLVFVGVSIAVPIVANWLRAYIIVMLGHLSGNKLAAGVDHLIYGWVFFGVVIMAMFWIGARWREDEPQSADLPSNGMAVSSAPKISSLTMMVIALVLLPLWPLAQWKIEQGSGAPVAQVSPVDAIAGWQISAELLTNWGPSFSTPSAVTHKTFDANGTKVGVYIGYYRNQDYSRKLVSSSNVLVRSNDPLWARVASGTRQIEFGDQSLLARTAELRSSADRLVVWQWYWVNGYLTASDYKAKAVTALSRITGQGDDSAVIVVYAPKEQAGGEAALESFVRVAGPEIVRALNRTREQH